ncbi:TPA: DNA repair protein RecO, partial [Candidatus Micrarchaeota archaeon]|nr:DNA repair protein RecO [Candidatus Micrarchaeota archaeon]
MPPGSAPPAGCRSSRALPTELARLRRGWGIVLSAKDAQETDRLVAVLTEREGKVTILVKRARRIESPYGAVLEPTNRVELIYYVREGLYLLKEASLLRRFPRIRGELVRLEAALEGLHFAERLLPERVSEPQVLALTQTFLEELEKGAPPDVLLLAYEIKVLSVLGHGPHLEGCVRCG